MTSAIKAPEGKTMYKQWSLRAIFLMSAGISLPACHLIQQMDGMAENTDKLKVGTEKVRETSDELYDALRQGSAVQVRTQLFKSILESESSGRKIADSVHLLMAFEYQLFNGFAKDQNPEKRLILQAEAVQEFFMLMKDVYVQTDKVDVLAQGDAKNIYSVANKEATFNAMALGLHMVNRKQQENVTRTGMELISMQSMISEALLMETSINNRTMALDQVPIYAKHVLNNKRMAIKLLQARHNMFKVVFLGETSPLLEGSSKFAKIKQFATMNLSGWELDVSAMPLTQVSEFNHMFELMRNTQQLLESLNTPLQKNKWVERMLSKVELKDLPNKEDSDRNELIKNLIVFKSQ